MQRVRAAVPEATAATAAEVEPPAPPSWPRPRHLAFYVLVFIALVGSLYLARAFFIPLLIAVLGAYALRPLVDRLHALRVPRALGAALILSLLVAGLGWLVLSLRDDASALIEGLPQAARKLRHEVSAAQAKGPSPLQKVQEAATELQRAAAEATGTRQHAAPAPVSPEPVWLRDYLLAQTALLIAVAAQAPLVLLLAYFLLASGGQLRRTLVRLAGPTLSDKKLTVGVLDEINAQIQRYMFAMLLANTLVGLGTWLSFAWLGLEHAGAWGVAAGVLHFIPYLGPSLIALASGVAAYLQFGSLVQAFGVASASLLVAGVAGLVFFTWLQSRVSRVGAVAQLVALLFFGWLWGAWGLLLGAPLLAIVKGVCDRVEALRPAGELLGN
jgi:predicted PurR-regulated permease PerM